LVREGSENARALAFLQGLAQAAAQASAATTEEQVLDQALQTLKDLGMKPTIMVRDPIDGRYRVRSTGFDESMVQKAIKRFGVDAGTFSVAADTTETHARVINGQHTEFVRDAAEMTAAILPPSVAKIAVPLMRMLGMPSIILSPIVVDERTIGLLSVHQQGISEDDSAAVELFSTQIGTAIARLRLIEVLRRQNATITEAAERSKTMQRLEAMGHLASGICHDFNNLLTVILASGKILESESRLSGSESLADVHAIVDAAQSATKLTRQLLDFTRNTSGPAETFDAREQVMNLQAILRRALGPQVRLVLEAPSEPCYASGDSGKFDQVLMNLALNARDAMPSGGDLTVSLVADPGSDFVVLCVKDTGTGMDEQTQKRAFEPFFSTKLRGQGTGLGLSTCYGIVTGQGGNLVINSRLGVGTEIRAGFRAAEGAAPRARRPKADIEQSQRILLIDDSPGVLRAIQRLLERAGHEVDSFADAGEGLQAFFDSDPGTYTAVLTDMFMPGVSGVDVTARIIENAPEAVVVLMSGNFGDLSRLPTDGSVSFLPKPFTNVELLAALKSATEARSSVSPSRSRP